LFSLKSAKSSIRIYDAIYGCLPTVGYFWLWLIFDNTEAEKGEVMKKTNFIMAGALMALAMVFTSTSCSKKEDASKNLTLKEEQKLTPEQAIQQEKIKKGIKESQNIVIATVNGAALTMFDLVREMNAIAPKYVAAGQPTTPEITAKVKKEALNNLIFKELAVQEAIKEGMKVKPEAVEDVINKVRAQAGSEEAYKKYLEERNLSEEALKKTIERSHILEMITAREVFDKIEVDEKTLRHAYEKEKASFMTKENPPRQMSFEEAKGFIERRIKAEEGAKRIGEWNNKLREKSQIKVMLDEVEQKPKENAGQQKK
jgi:hypothetical protein